VLPVYLSEEKIWAIPAVSEDYDALSAPGPVQMLDGLSSIKNKKTKKMLACLYQ
jgi:hypothetical protein